MIGFGNEMEWIFFFDGERRYRLLDLAFPPQQKLALIRVQGNHKPP